MYAAVPAWDTVDRLVLDPFARFEDGFIVAEVWLAVIDADDECNRFDDSADIRGRIDTDWAVLWVSISVPGACGSCNAEVKAEVQGEAVLHPQHCALHSAESRSIVSD